MKEFIQKQGESRKEYLVRVAISILIDGEGLANVVYDGAECDAETLADDLALEFEILADIETAEKIYVSRSIFCDDCGEEIHGLYEDHKDGTYTCISCDLKRQDGADLDNCMG